MRDPNRIDPFLQKLGTIWKEECPDWRFGQLIENVLLSNDKLIWIMEEDRVIDVFEEFFNRKKTYEESEHNYFNRKKTYVKKKKRGRR